MTKYILPFYDEDGNSCQVSFDIEGYTGDPIVLIGGATPLVIAYNGDPNDIFQQIIDSKASITVDYNEQFLNDTRDIDDKQVLVNINYGLGLKWVGFLIADERIETFDQTTYDVELTAVDPFSYLKDSSNKILSTTELMGLQRVYDIIKGVMDSSVEMPVTLYANIAPFAVIGGHGQSYRVDGLFKDVLMRAESFMEDGLMISGYDIISAICDIFCLTSFVFNGITTFRQARFIEDQESKKIGVLERGNPEYLIGNEQITRSRGVKQLGVRQSYPDDLGGSIDLNSRFYFFDPSKPVGTEILGWTYPTVSGLSITQPRIKKEDFKGITINGLVSDSVIRPAWTAPNIPKYLVTITETVKDYQLGGGYLYLRFKYKYHTYDQSQPTKTIQYGFNIVAQFNDGDLYAVPYNGDGGRINKNSVWSHLTNSEPAGSGIYFTVPQIIFPLANSESEQTFELTVDCTNLAEFPVSKGDFKLMVILWPVQKEGINADFAGDHTIGSDAIPPDINITEVSIMPDVWYLNNDQEVTTKYKHLFNNDETNIRNSRNYSEVSNTLDVKAGVIYGAGNTYANPKAIIPWIGLEGSLMINPDPLMAVETFVISGLQGKLITLNARERMYYNRKPGNLIQCDVRSSSLKFTDVLEFPEVIGGKYLQLSDEYNVKACTHSLALAELNGSEDVNDIIENNLTSE